MCVFLLFVVNSVVSEIDRSPEQICRRNDPLSVEWDIKLYSLLLVGFAQYCRWQRSGRMWAACDHSGRMRTTVRMEAVWYIACFRFLNTVYDVLTLHIGHNNDNSNEDQ